MAVNLLSKTEVLKKDIIRKISKGEYQPCEKIDSIRKLAENYKVSKHTASQVISNLVSLGYLENQQGVGTFVQKNPGGDIRVPGRREAELKTIGLETSTRTSSQSEFINELTRGALEGARKNGYELSLFQRDDLLGPWEGNTGLKGLIVNYVPEYRYDVLKGLSEELSLVFVNNDCPVLGLPFVGFDNEKAGVMAARHLIERGHSDIGMLSFPSGTSSVQERITGYKIALAEAGLLKGRAKIASVLNLSETPCVSDIRNAVDELLQAGKMTALLCINSTIAILVSRYLRSLGLRIPEDMAVAAFDDCMAAQMCDVPLTVTTQPAYEIGFKSVELCIKPSLAQKERKILFEPGLIVREST